MKLQDQNILLFARTMKLGGTENVVLQLCEIFKPLVHKITVCSCGGVNTEKLKSMGIRHYTIPDIEDRSPVTIIQTIKRIKKIVIKEKITVIHTHHRMAAFYVRLMGLDKKCVFINTSHNTFENKRLLTRFAYKNCHLIACGEMVKKNLQKTFGLDNVTVIHNAVKAYEDKNAIDKNLSRARAEGKYLIGNIGRLSEQKGMEYYIKAIPEVKKLHPEAEFYIIGSGEDEKKLKQLCKELAVTVHFMGYRSDAQNLMSQLDLVVLSSLWEGLPLTPIEAFSVGKTIVATGVDGTLEIVKNRKNGLLVKPKDPHQIAKKINWMIEHPAEQKQMELFARKTFADEFNFKILAQSYTNFYRRIG